MADPRRRHCAIIAVAAVLALVIALPVFLPQAGFVHRDGKNLVAADGKPLSIRGIGLGNWLVPEGYMFGFDGGAQSPREIEILVNELIGPAQAAEFWRQYRDAYITEEDMRFIHQAGFNAVRVPLHYKFFAPGETEGFRLLDRLVGWAGKYGIYVIFDLHAAPGGQTGTNIDDSWGYPWLFASPENQEQTIELWKRIAGHYRNNPAVLGYDLLNEPIPTLLVLQQYNVALEPLYKRIAAGIREVDPHHVIILEGAQWGYNFGVFGPPFDANAMYSFHYYWAPPTKEGIKPFLDFREKVGVPVFLGESGENTDKWIHSFVTVLDDYQIGWSFWPYKKMGAASGMVSWPKPSYWDEIVAFAKVPAGTGNAEKRMAVRPSPEHSQAAFRDLLDKIRFAQCRVNAGYLKALGLPEPVKKVTTGMGN